MFSNYLDSLPAKHKKWKLDNLEMHNNNNDNSLKTRKILFSSFSVLFFKTILAHFSKLGRKEICSVAFQFISRRTNFEIFCNDFSFLFKSKV